ncbi:MAG: hypothetical protein GAK28_04144 [Luteibacter sp.]|nr:MAG: hypothetical protein GAK28_04144 [Luteibacter sp.]
MGPRQEKRILIPPHVVPANAGTQREAIGYRLAASYAKVDATPSRCWRTEALGSCFHRNDELAIRRSSARWNPARGDRLSPRGLLRTSRCDALAVLVNRGAGFLFSQERRARDPSFQRTLEPSARRSVIASRPPTHKPMRRPRRAGEPRRWVPVFTGTTSVESEALRLRFPRTTYLLESVVFAAARCCMRALKASMS